MWQGFFSAISDPHVLLGPHLRLLRALLWRNLAILFSQSFIWSLEARKRNLSKFTEGLRADSAFNLFILSSSIKQWLWRLFNLVLKTVWSWWSKQCTFGVSTHWIGRDVIPCAVQSCCCLEPGFRHYQNKRITNKKHTFHNPVPDMNGSQTLVGLETRLTSFIDIRCFSSGPQTTNRPNLSTPICQRIRILFLRFLPSSTHTQRWWKFQR